MWQSTDPPGQHFPGLEVSTAVQNAVLRFVDLNQGAKKKQIYPSSRLGQSAPVPVLERSENRGLEGGEEIGCKLARNILPSELCCGLAGCSITLPLAGFKHLPPNSFGWTLTSSFLKATEVGEMLIAEAAPLPNSSMGSAARTGF